MCLGFLLHGVLKTSEVLIHGVCGFKIAWMLLAGALDCSRMVATVKVGPSKGDCIAVDKERQPHGRENGAAASTPPEDGGCDDAKRPTNVRPLWWSAPPAPKSRCSSAPGGRLLPSYLGAAALQFPKDGFSKGAKGRLLSNWRRVDSSP